MLSVTSLQAGLAAIALCLLGGFAISAAVAMVTAPISPKLSVPQPAAATLKPIVAQVPIADRDASALGSPLP